MQAFIARLAGIGTAMDQLLVRAQSNARAGTRPPRFSYDAVISEAEGLITGKPFTEGGNSALWEGVEERLANLVAGGIITQNRASELAENARVAMVNEMAPAYQRVIDWLFKTSQTQMKLPKG